MNTEKEVKKNCRWFLLFFICAKICFTIVAVTVTQILYHHFNFSYIKALSIGAVTAFSLALLVSFNKFSQCIFMLMIPQLLRKRGRMFVIGYAFLVAFSHPGKNLMQNAQELTDSLACITNQVKQALHELINAFKEPFQMLKKVIGKVLPVIKKIADKIEKVVKTVQMNLIKVANTIKKAFSWLLSIANLCKKEKESPYEQCLKAVEKTMTNCREKLGVMDILCDVTYLAKSFCVSFESLEVVCDLIDFMSDSVLQEILEKMKKFIRTVESIFYVSIHFEHNFHFDTNFSKSFDEIRTEIISEIDDRTHHAFKFIESINFFLTFYFIFIIGKAVRFRYKFLTNLRYKNFYITKKFHEIDSSRRELGMETILPLTYKERKSYVEVTSIRTIWQEWHHMLSSSINLICSTLYLCGILVTDYSLYWLLSMIKIHGSQSDNDIESEVQILTVQVAGEGIVAEFCQELVKVSEPLMKILNINFTKCLPNPKVPNYSKYQLIGLLVAIAWIVWITEPFASRFSNVIMNHYYPERAKDRTVWLYQNLINKRTSFLKFTRKQVKFFKGDEKFKSRSCMEILRAKLDNFWIFRKIFGFNREMCCVICGYQQKDVDDLTRCHFPNCVGIYCHQCYSNLNKVCPLCHNSMSDDESSDVSEELDSDAMTENSESTIFQR